MVLAGALAPLVAPYSYSAQSLLQRLQPPGGFHWLGTDGFGRDILSRIIWGSRVSLEIGFCATGLALLIGIALGSAAGFEHYEISNFARPGFESLHNLKYWRLEPYTGFGADAHSFDGDMRRQNVEAPHVRLISMKAVSHGDSAVIDVNGVGYLVSASARTLRDLVVGGAATLPTTKGTTMLRYVLVLSFALVSIAGPTASPAAPTGCRTARRHRTSRPAALLCRSSPAPGAGPCWRTPMRRNSAKAGQPAGLSPRSR